MTDPDKHEEYDDRAARAFSAAFERAADGHQPVPLEPTMSKSRGRDVLARLGAVAAAVALVAAGTSYGVWRFGDGNAENTHRDVLTSPSLEPGDDLEPPGAGWRYESYRDAVVEVPDSWGHASSPGTDWCAAVDNDEAKGDGLSRDPFVDLRSEFQVTLSIACFQESDSAIFGNVPERMWRTHLGFGRSREAGGFDALPDGEVTEGGWTRIVRTVGAAQVRVFSDSAHLDTARRVADSARQVSRDHHGCPVTSPIQAGHFARPQPVFDVTDLDTVEAIKVCQYDTRTANGPGLLASRELRGEPAERELRTIQDAPVGGGPDTPRSCAKDMWGDTAVVLQLRAADAVNRVHVYYEWCFGNGFDDGTSIRRLTRANCPPLWGDRLFSWSGSSAPFRACHPER